MRIEKCFRELPWQLCVRRGEAGAHVGAFVTDDDDPIWSSYHDTIGQRREWFPIHFELRVFPGAAVTALQTSDTHIGLFVTGRDRTVWSTYFAVIDKLQDWFPINPEIRRAPGVTVTALQKPTNAPKDVI